MCSARRGRRCAAGAREGAVCASLRLHCGARTEVAPHNSLRSLRSLRSDKRGGSVHDARGARRPRSCAPRRPQPRPHRTPPAAPQQLGGSAGRQTPVQQRRARAVCGAPVGRRGAQGSWRRAQRASWADSARLSERSERSERSELRDAATRPSTAGQSERSADRPTEARQAARARLCRALPATRPPDQPSSQTPNPSSAARTAPLMKWLSLAHSISSAVSRSCGLPTRLRGSMSTSFLPCSVPQWWWLISVSM